jgi:hypothetical protein
MEDLKKVIGNIRLELECVEMLNGLNGMALRVALKRIKDKSGVDLSDYFDEIKIQPVTKQEADCLRGEGPSDVPEDMKEAEFFAANEMKKVVDTEILANVQGESVGEIEAAKLYVYYYKLAEYVKMSEALLSQRLKHLGVIAWEAKAGWYATDAAIEYVVKPKHGMFPSDFNSLRWDLRAICALLGQPVE